MGLYEEYGYLQRGQYFHAYSHCIAYEQNYLYSNARGWSQANHYYSMYRNYSAPGFFNKEFDWLHIPNFPKP